VEKTPAPFLLARGSFELFRNIHLYKNGTKPQIFVKKNESLEPVEVQGFHKWWTVQDSNL